MKDVLVPAVTAAINVDALTFLLENSFIRFGTKLFGRAIDRDSNGH